MNINTYNHADKASKLDLVSFFGAGYRGSSHMLQVPVYLTLHSTNRSKYFL